MPNNNNVLIAGGTFGGLDLEKAELYTPWTGQFTATGSMTTPRSGAVGGALSPLADGLLLVAGGNNSGTAQKSAELYGFATVKTDKPDYQPGEVVTITGSGWQPGETVTLHLQESPFVDAPPDMTAVADSSGNIINNSFVPDLSDQGIRFYLTATGSTSGTQAQNTFRDATSATVTVLGSQTPNPVMSGSSATYGTTANGSIQVHGTGSGGCTFTPTVTGLPPGATASFNPATITGLNNKVNKFTLLTINTSASTPAGTTTITVGGTGCSGTTSASTTLVVSTASVAPTITSANNATFTVGTAGSFTVTATGSPAPTFSETGALPSGVTLNSTTGVLSGTPAAGTGGSYPITITATNGVAPDATQNFTLTVNEAPAVTTQPVSQTVTYGNNASFSAAATTGYPAPTVQWQVSTDGGATWADIAGATGTTFTLTSPSVSSSGNQYHAVFTNTSGSATSNAASLTVNSASVTASVIAANRAYDGTAAATITSCSLSGSPANVTCAAAGPNTFGDANVGIGKTVTATNIGLSGSAAANYQLSSTTATTTADITAVTVTASVTAANKAYDGTTAATITSCSLSGSPANVTCAAAGPNTFGDANVGIGKTVTATNIGLSGSAAANYQLSSTTATSTADITKANQTITVTTHAPASAGYNSSFTVAATSSSGLAVAYSASGSCTNTGATYTMTSGSGTCTVAYNQAGDANYNAATQVAESTNATKANQTITFTGAPASAAYNSTFTVTATASSGLSVTLGASGSCSISGTTVTMTSGSGTCLLTADQAGDANYNAAPQATQSTTATKANQTITVTTHAPASAGYNSNFTVAATSSSGLAVAYSASGSCTNTGATYTMTSGSGTCTVAYNQAGDANYNAATQVTESTTAAKADQAALSVTGMPGTAQAYGATFTVSTSGGTGTGAVTFAATGACSVDANSGLVTITSGSGTCSVTATKAADANYNSTTSPAATVAASQGAVSIALSASPNPSNVGQAATITATLTANSPASGTPTGTVNFYRYDTHTGNTLLGTGTLNASGIATFTISSLPVGSLSLRASYGGDSNFQSVFPPTIYSQQVNLLTPTINWNNPADIVYGTALSGTQLNATATYSGSPVAGTFAYTPAAGAILSAGAGQTLSVTFTPTDGATYAPVSKTVSINVLKATPTITWANPADIAQGVALSGTQLNATASVPGAFVYTPPAGTVLALGSGQTLSTTFTPTDTANYNTATASVTINVVAKTVPTITWANPADITYGTALGASQLNASADTAGSFDYSPPAGTVLNGGSGQILSVTFTPTDTANYTTAMKTVTINVLPASQTITFGALAGKTYGDAPFAVSATASSGLAVSFAAAGNCSVSGSTVTITGAGGCTITASQAGNTNFSAATPVPQTFAIAKADQTITFGALSNKLSSDPPFAVSASASSGLAVSFSASGNCTVSGSTVTITAAGSCTVTAAQTGGADYKPATPVPQTFTITQAGGDPDLVVSSLSIVSPSAISGGALQVRDTTSNSGGANATTSYTGFYLSTDGVTKGSLLGSRNVGTLAASASSGPATMTFSLPQNLNGPYYVIACADFTGSVVESNESNNCSVAGPVTVTGADLVVSGMSIVTAAPVAGGTLQVTDTTANPGGGNAPNSYTGFYLSTDGLTKGSSLGSRSVGALAPGGSSGPVTTTLTLPANLNGAFYVIACADFTGSVVETNESNNCSVAGPVTVAGADLAVSGISIVTTAPSSGGSLQLTDTTTNQGGGKATSSYTGFYLSADGVTKGAPLGSHSVPALTAGTSSGPVTTTLTLPSNLNGSYYVIACADFTGSIVETNETNNCMRSSNQMTIGGGADLVVTGASILTAAPVSGGTLQVRDTTANQGGTSATSSYTGFYLSTNGVTKGSLLGSRNVGSLAGGASSGPATTTLNLPLNLNGPYYVIACADFTGSVVETNEANNCSLAGPVTITGADLVVSAVSIVTAAPVSGGSLQVTDTIANQSSGKAASSYTGFYLSTDGITKGSPLGSRNAPVLAASTASGPVTTTLTLPMNLNGSYYVIACADFTGAVVESNEANNCAVAGPVTITGADLVVSGVTIVTAAPVAGGSLQLTDTTVNQNSGKANSTYTGFYLSRDGVTKAGLLGSRNVPVLPGNTSSGPVTTTFTLPATASGTYYVIGCADFTGSVVETNEANNCTVSGQMTIQ